MKRNRSKVATNARELAMLLGLDQADAAEIEVRSGLNDKIIEIVERQGLTHLTVAERAHTSRTRVTAILNRNTNNVSVDLMLRILGSLGYRAKLSFSKVA